MEASNAQAWTAEQVGAWIATLDGLAQYRAAFEGNAIDGARLLERVGTTASLTTMGVADHEDQRRLLGAIKELRIACGLDAYTVPEQLTANEALLSPAEFALCRSLCLEAGQMHLFGRWPAPGTEDEGKRSLVAQLVTLDEQYPGGLLQYHRNALSLLGDSAAGVNSFDGFIPAVPNGVDLSFGTESFRAAENTGLAGVGGVGFVLVAGGLGERLGYGGIKVTPPAPARPLYMMPPMPDQGLPGRWRCRRRARPAAATCSSSASTSSRCRRGRGGARAGRGQCCRWRS